MVSVTINGDLTGDVTGDPPNMAGGQLIVGDGTLPLISQNWEITTPPANGTASIDADTGEWTYTVDPAFFDSLDDNEVVFDTFFVQVTGAVEIAGFAVPYGSDPTEISIRIEGVCFTSGTLIDTPNGSRLIETLTVGDVITTADRGAQPIR
ncbi:MAG: Hint domain-containing protein, partial [Pseudomonadota bacterium]